MVQFGNISHVGTNKVTVKLRQGLQETQGMKEETQELIISKRDIVQLNHPHTFARDAMDKIILEDGKRCDYKNRTVRAKLVEICLCLDPVVKELNFFSHDRDQIQLEAVRIIRSCLNVITFQVQKKQY